MLAEIGNTDVVRSLVTMLQNEKGEPRREIIEALTMIGQRALEPLATALADSNIGRRAVVAQVLGNDRWPTSCIPC